MSSSGYTEGPQWSSSQYSAPPQLQLENELDFMPGKNQQRYPQQQHPAPLLQNASAPLQYPRFMPNQYVSASNGTFSSGDQQPQNPPLSYGSPPHPTSAPQVDAFRSTGSSQSSYGATVPPSQATFNPSVSYFNKSPSFTNHSASLPYRQQFTQRHAPMTSPDDMLANLSGDDGGLSPPYASSPPMHLSLQQTQFKPQHYMQPHEGQSHLAKRHRASDDTEDSKEDIINGDHDSGDLQVESPTQKDGGKAKGPGACARCKTLKVRCEFRTDTDPCKRCMNGGHECVIPGRKKRRTPPKREHLLSQIRDQAAQIQRLMAQLESTNLHTTRPALLHTPSSPADLHSPILDPTTLPQGTAPAGADVQDWIAKARESIEAFGGFIGVGGSGMTKGLLVQEDPEDSDSSGEEQYESAVDEAEGPPELDFGDQDETGHLIPPHPRSGRARSLSKEPDTPGGQPRKKDSSGAGTEKLAILPSGASPFGLIANLALKNPKGADGAEEEEHDDDDVGVANRDFFRPSPGPDPMRGRRIVTDEQQLPHILTRSIITPDEAEKLFGIYFDYMNISVSLLDPILYTAQKTCWRSPFLFTVVCAIASRYYTERPDLYTQAMHYAQLAAGTALISGQKSVEVCQAYILLCLYPVPARRWEEDRSWIYLGLAIRVATDLNLHHPNTAKPLNEQHAREMLNRNRVWLNCFNLDRSTGSQYGKAPIIKNTDYVANHSEGWWESSEFNMTNFDIHLCAYNAELRVVAHFVGRIYSDPNHPTGLNKEVDFEQIATETDDELVRLGDIWFARLDKTDQADPQNRFRTGLLRLAYSYARLVALSFGFQHSFGKNNTDENPFLLRCLRAATDVVNTVVNDVGRPNQRKYLRHGPEAQSVFVTFASAFLVKLLQPKFASYLTRDQRLEIRGLVEKVVDLLGSPEVAIDDRHGPKLYSRFLKGLLATPMAKVDYSPNGLKQTSSLPRRKSRKKKTASATSPDSEQGFDFTVSNHTSPSSASLSPPPNTAAMSFDQFAPVGMGVDPFAPQAHVTLGNGGLLDPLNDLGMNVGDFFQPPLPFDSELLESMQALSDPSWQEMAMPGFAWMSQMQTPESDIHMKASDAMMYNPQQHYSS